MKRRLLLAVLPVTVLVVVLAGTGDATSAAPGATGVTQGQPWTGSPGVTVSVADLMARQRAEDRRRAGQPPATRDRPEPGEGPTQPKSPGNPAPQQRTGSAAVAPKSELTPGTSFLGAHMVGDALFRPPDSTGAVGPTQVMVTVNGRFRVFNKDGTDPGVLDVTDGDFWSLVSGGLDVTDPQLEYDRLSGRWIISQINFDPDDPSMTNNRIMVAVSSGSTITSSSSFTLHFFEQNDPDPEPTALFADYPQMGVDANAVYIGTNDFDSSGDFASTTAFVINKADLLAGADPLTVTAFRNLAVGSGAGPVSPQPAQDMDPNVSDGYIVGVDNATFSQLDVRRITDPGGTPAISGNLPVAVPTTRLPEPVPAQGSPHKLDALDDRLFEAMIARDPNGIVSLWTAHNIEVNSSGVASTSGGRDGARWYQLGTLSTTPQLAQSGTLFDSASSSPRYFWIPSIAMNGQGHASLNSSTAGTGRFAGVASSAHLASDPIGTTEPFDLTQSSSSSYNLGDTPDRWGDYSQTVVDPNDNMTFWTFQEYTNATNDWGVRVIKLKAPPPATPSTASPSNIDPGLSSVSVEITGTSVNGSGFFDPGPDTGGPGYPDHIGASVSGGVVVNSVTADPTDPTKVTLDLDTTGVSTEGPKNVTITNPDGQSKTGSNILVVGSDVTPPAPPTLGGTVPLSPGNSTTPKVFGGAEGGSTVKLYTDDTCSGSVVATGSQLAFASPGIPVSVTSNFTTTFYATATDVSDNTSDCSSTLGSSGSVSYLEDSVSPQVTIGSGPSGTTSDSTPTFTFSATDSFPLSDPITFKCSIDTGFASFSACSGPGNSDTPASPLADGSYTFRVRATDAASNSTVASRTFAVDTPSPPGPPVNPGATAPDTTFTKGPKKTRKRRPKFKFTSSQAGSTFQCKLDRGHFDACTSPYRPPSKLRPGKHVLRVQAIGPTGIADPAPAVRKFKVLPAA